MSFDGALKQDPKPYQIHKNRYLLASELPPDAPEMVVRWHYAVDVPKRRLYEKPGATKPKQPANFVAFSARDSKSIEQAWAAGKDSDDFAKLPVNEDHLFEVDISERELGPIYWKGPIYEVRRGTWHFADSGILKPCEENLANQVEQGYIAVKPFRDDVKSTSGSGQTTPISGKAPEHAISSKDKLLDVTRDSRLLATPETGDKVELDRRRSLNDKTAGSSMADSKRDTQRDHMRPLFGAYAGKYVLYTGKTTAWLLSDDLYGKISSSFLQSVTRGVHMGGQKLKRGYSDPEPSKTQATNEAGAPDDLENSDAVALPSLPAMSKAAKEADAGTGTSATNQSEMEKDYDINGTDNPDRKIEHLLLCCHGIGQKLGERIESVNFVTDVNILRRNFKSTFMHSRDLQTLSNDRYNCGVQVLPVEWRQNIQFGMSKDYDDPAQKSEKDLSSAFEQEEEEHATLQDITIEGVQTIRNLVSDVLLDILLYYQPSYREKIVRAVSKECNRVYALFKERNPSFKGKVSILGHSLGSAIAFDILCRQPTESDEISIPSESQLDQKLALEFPVENFYAVGSPIGLFQMLRGKNIAARSQLKTTDVPFSPLAADHPDFFDGPPASYPKVRNLFNIFHPSDPVSYRIEPLISKHAAKLRPYPMQYTKAGIRQQLVGLSSIPQRAFEGATSYWGALRSSITNSIVSRSLGYSELSSPSSSKLKSEIEDEKQRVANEISKQHEETLFAGFEKAWGTKSKTEGSEKLKALNQSGRIDFAIQEDMFGSSYMSAISAHLAYWADSDLTYFMLSYMLLHGQTSKKEEVGTPLRLPPKRMTTDL